MSNKRKKPTNADKRAVNAKKQAILQRNKPKTGALSNDELEHLEDLLLNLPLVDEAEEKTFPALSIEEIDGLFAALALHPQVIMPSEWIENVLRDSVFETQAQAEQVMGLLMRHYNHVVSHVRKNTTMGEYQPLLAAEDDDVSEWCRGFMLGAQLGDDENAFMLQLPEDSDAFAAFTFILAMQSWDVSTNDFFPSDRDALEVENMKGFVEAFKQITTERAESGGLADDAQVDIHSHFFITYMCLLMIRLELDTGMTYKPLSHQQSRVLH